MKNKVLLKIDVIFHSITALIAIMVAIFSGLHYYQESKNEIIPEKNETFIASKRLSPSTFIEELDEIVYESPSISIEPFIYISPCWQETNEVFVHGAIDEDFICTRCSEYVAPRYGFTEDEIFLLTQLLCGDKKKSGDGEYDFDWDIRNGKELNHYEIGKVLCVVMNRVRSKSYPNDIKKVVIQKNQFSVVPYILKTDPESLAIDVIRDWCWNYDRWDISVQCIPEDHLYFSAGPNNTNKTRAKY